MFCHDVQCLMDLLVEQGGNIMAEPPSKIFAPGNSPKQTADLILNS